MDCAPCAYGLEKRIKNIDGVQSASVSLNQGLLTATFEKENTLTLQRIREAVEQSGFKGKEANLTVTGTVTEDKDGNFVLVTGAGERFILKAEEQSTLVNILEKKSILTVTGVAEESNGDDTILQVHSIDNSKV